MSVNDNEVRIKISADGSEAVDGLDAVEKSNDELVKALKEVRKELEKLHSGLKGLASNSKDLSSEFDDLRGDTSNLEKENKKLAAQLSQTQRELNRVADRSRSLETQIKSLSGKTNELGLSSKQMAGILSSLSSDMDRLAASAAKSQQALNKIKSGFEFARKEARAFADGINKIGEGWAEFTTGLNQGLELLGKVKRGFDSAWNLANQGAIVEETRVAFAEYTRSVGINADEMLAKLKKSSGGTINEFELMKTASLAMSLGVTTDMDKMANLLEISRNKARLFGVSTKQAFDDLVTGIGRASPKILDNLGIRIPAGFEQLTDGMTDAEKVAKLFEMTLEEGNKQLSEMGGLTRSRADEMRNFQASIDDLTADFGILVADGLGPFVIELRENVIPAAKEAIIVLRDLADETKISGDIYARQGIAGQIAKNKETIESLKKQRKELAAIMQTPVELFRQGLDEKYGLGIKLKDNISDQEIRSAIQARIREINLQMRAANEELERARNKAWSESIFKGVEQDRQDADETIAALTRLGNEIERNTDKTKKRASALKEVKEVYIDLLDATSAHYQMHRDVLPTIDNLEGGLLSVVSAFEDMIDVTGVSGNELLKIPFLEVAEQAAELANSVDLIKKAMGEGFDKASISMAKDAVGYLQKGMVGYFDFMSAGQSRSVWDAYGGNILSAVWGSGSETQDKKTKENISKTIAEAVSTGFANADFSNFSQTLGQMLSNVLSKSVSNKFPIIGGGGDVNWGNLGINLGVSAATQLLTRSGRFFGGREEHGKEAIQQSADLKTNLSNTWLETFSAGLLPYLSDSAGEMMKLALADARSQIWGTSVGYKWSDSGDGIFSDRTRTYELINSGATSALESLEKAIENAEDYNREVERSIEILVASGKDFAALQQQALAFESAAESAKRLNDSQGLSWSDGAKFTTDLGDQIHDLVVTSEELIRQLGSATAERTSIISEGFTSYAPWLDTIPLKMAQGSGIRVNIKSPDGSAPEMPSDWGAWSSGINVSDLSTSELYSAFADLQTSFLDREIPNYLVDMVEQAALNQFELEKLKITDEDLYQTTYLDYLDRQAEAHKEIVERQREIFEDETKTYEERAAALQLLEGAIQNYHRIEIEKLQKKAAAEEEEKRLMAQRSRENIESSLSVLGEISQRNGNVLIIQSGDVSAALGELMTRFADDPEVTAILKKSKELADAQALWGKR